MGDGNEVVNPDLGPEPELASRHFSETQDAKSEQGPLKRAGFRDGSCDRNHDDPTPGVVTSAQEVGDTRIFLRLDLSRRNEGDITGTRGKAVSLID